MDSAMDFVKKALMTNPNLDPRATAVMIRYLDNLQSSLETHKRLRDRVWRLYTRQSAADRADLYKKINNKENN